MVALIASAQVGPDHAVLEYEEEDDCWSLSFREDGGKA